MYSSANPVSWMSYRYLLPVYRLPFFPLKCLLMDKGFNINVAKRIDLSFYAYPFFYLRKFFPTSSSERYSLIFSFQVFRVCFWHLSSSSIWSEFFGMVWLRIQFLFFFPMDKQFFQLFLFPTVLSKIKVSQMYTCFSRLLEFCTIGQFISAPLLHCLNSYSFPIGFFT